MKGLSNTPLTLVAFGAHPDPFDMPDQAGGTLAKYAKRGHRVIIEREETNIKFRGFQVEREYCEIFQVALNYRVTWAHDLLPIATLPPIKE